MSSELNQDVRLGCATSLAKGMKSMRAFLLAVAIGVGLAVGASLGTGALLAGVANGKPVNAQLYNYGQR